MKNNIIFMFIHGFGGGPFELTPLKEVLKNRGFTVFDLVLPGHLLGKKGLRSCNVSQWLMAVDSLYNEIKVSHKHAKIIVVGFSMGGLLGAHLGCKYNLDGFITLNTPIRYWNFENVLLNIKSGIKSKEVNVFKRYLVSCTMYPINALWQFNKLLYKAKPCFEKITCPTLIIQAKNDDAVHYKSADYILKAVSGQEKKRIFMDKGGHGLLLGEGKTQAIEHVVRFVEQTYL